MGQATLVAAQAAPLASGPVVSVRGFCKRYGKQTAVEDVDLDLPPGEIYGLIGPDGAGKSSLLKAIAGVLAFDGGTVDVFDTRLDSEAAAERVKGRLGFMPQGLGLNLYADLSVEENIDFFARLRGVPRRELAERKRKLLAMTRLDRFTERPMKHLSGGMKQKLGLICTLVHEPELIILDEPTTGVDPVSRRDFWAILAELLRSRGITALISTAYLDEAERFHRLSLIYQGCVLASGEPDAIRGQVPGSLVELAVEPQVEALKLIKAEFGQAEAMGPRLRVFVDHASPQEAARKVSGLVAGLALHDIQAKPPGLEDVFVGLLRTRQMANEEVAGNQPDADDGHTPVQEGVAILGKDLVRDFDAFRAVDHASISVRQGEIFGLLGANGAGKTTLIKMLTGIIPPSGGEGQVAGANMRGASRAIKEHIGYMSQAFSLYQDLTVLENIRLFGRIYGVPRLRQRIDQVIALAGLQGRQGQLAGSLPLGIRQRLALGCALVHRPRILFLDEPTSGVDPIGRRRFWDILNHLSRVEHVAILITTHYMSEAEHCDRLALMYAGRIVADASPAALKQALREEVGELLEVTTDGSLAAMALLEQAGFAGVALFGKHIHLLASDPEAATREIRSLFGGRGIALASITQREPEMEDVFVYRVTELERQEGRP